MENHFIASAKQIYAMALRELDAHRVVEAYTLLEMAFAAAFMADSAVFIEVRLLPRAALPRPVLSVDHVVAHLSRQKIRLFAAADIITRPLFTFERFPVVGHLLSRVAQRLPDCGDFEAIADLGDGDGGNQFRQDQPAPYRWIAFSAASPDAILVPDPYVYFNRNYEDYRRLVATRARPWRAREDKIFWRGGSGGPRLRPPDPQDPMQWGCQQRLQLCAAARDSRHPAMLDVGLVHLRTIPEAFLRDALSAGGFLRPEVPKLDFLNYRHQIDIDGWTNSWSLLDKLISGATILKVQSAGGYRQWFYDRLVPWRNFIPLAPDCSDLDTVIEWMISHPTETEMIAGQGAALGAEIQLDPALEDAVTAIRGAVTPL